MPGRLEVVETCLSHKCVPCRLQFWVHVALIWPSVSYSQCFLSASVGYQAVLIKDLGMFLAHLCSPLRWPQWGGFSLGSSQNLDHLHVSTCVLYPLSLSWSQPRLSRMETCHLARPSYSYCLCTRSQASTLPDPSALTCSGGLATESLEPGAAGQATHSASTCSGTCLWSAHLSDGLLHIRTLVLAAHLGEHFKHPP